MNFVAYIVGIMDQFAVAMGKKDHCTFIKPRKLWIYEYIPIYTVAEVRINYCEYPRSNKRGIQLGESKYNERREECETALVEIFTGNWWNSCPLRLG